MVIRDKLQAVSAKRHPQGPNSTGSWRGDALAKVPGAKIMGKGKPDPLGHAYEHRSAPLTTLKDPDSFGPPPKNINYHGGGTAASPTTTAQRRIESGASAASRPPMSQDQVGSTQQQREQANQNEPYKPPVPYRANTTGLSVEGLPKPPTHRALLESTQEEGSSPPLPNAYSRPTPSPSTRPAYHPPQQAKPAPPPRLPPRQNSHPDLHTPAAPPAYGEAAEKPPPQPPRLTQSPVSPQHTQPTQQSYINAQSAQNLSRSGVSVPGFNIGSRPSPPLPTATAPPSQLNELQARFARMNAGNGADAVTSDPMRSRSSSTGFSGATHAAAAAAAAAKKPPPPPPKKKTLAGVNYGGGDSGPSSPHGGDAPGPPPVPLASRPTF